ncbi:MAG TPA: beta-ketoacyl synthase N-terminal-like domain-containing protein [Polyangiaceae bacterium]|nr:beta-ketoacyl synthase N-terminal-like domain-containing protein [Polyangiaceae bacterium]
MNTPVLLTHVGAVTSMGLSAFETAFVYRAQGTGLRLSALADPETGEALLVGGVPTLEPSLVGAERAVELGKLALDDLWADGASALAGRRLHLWLCLDEWLTERDQQGVVPSVEVSRLLRAHARARFGEHLQVHVCALGAASPGRILDDALAELERGECEGVILGGVHSDQCPARIARLSQQKRLYSPENSDGVLLGEGAGFVTLLELGGARRLGVSGRAQLLAVGTGHDKARPDNHESVFEAAGLTLAVRRATEALRAQGQRAGWQFNDLGCESYRLSEWISVMTRTQAIWEEPQVSEAPAQRLGNLGAATVPVQLALVTEAWRRGYAPHARALCFAGSDDGFRVALRVESAG